MSASVVNLEDYRRKGPAALPQPPREAAPIAVAEAIEACLHHPDVLTVWEEGFLASIRRVPQLSVKQHAVLQRIFDKVNGASEDWAR
jgi:hypothetical protein